jgi:thioredoxin-like negative regulator of GroEL
VTYPSPHLFFKYLFLPGAISLWLLVFLLYAAPPAADKSITIVNQEAVDPLWKQRWDEARKFAQQGNFTAAISRYHEVLEEKPHIEEVKWELSQSYIEVQNFSEAMAILESLVETNPEKVDYLVSGGEAALAMGKIDLGSKLFGRALALDPNGPFSEKALRGLIEIFTKRGKKDLAIPLMEQLYQRGELDPLLVRELGLYYASREDFGRAAHYYMDLVDNLQVEPALRLEAAEVFSQSGRKEKAAGQLELYLQAKPEDNEQKMKLADYYYEQGEMRKALPHMLSLIDRRVKREEYLLAAARIYLYTLGRSDRALHYFEQYREEFPEGTDVSSEISTLQLIVANDLLAIVENDGVWRLWRDLARVTPDRIGIYRAMADMLENMGRVREKDLMEVLHIINIHEPKDIDTVAKLCSLYIKNNMYGDCLNFLETSREHHWDRGRYHLLRARCETGKGLDIETLNSYRQYLKIEPEDQLILEKAVDLAGRLGLVDQMRDIYGTGRQKSGSLEESVDASFIEGLLHSGLIEEALEGYRLLISQNINLRLASRLTERLSNAYLRSNRPFWAEQLLRSFAASHPDQADGYMLLANYHLSRQDSIKAEVWLKALDKLVQSSAIKLDLPRRSELFHLNLLYGQLLGRVGMHQKALSHLNSQIKANKIVAEDVEILLFAARHFLETNRYDEALTLIRRFRPKFKGVAKLQSLRQIILHEKNKKPAPISVEDFPHFSLSQRFALTDSLMALGRNQEARTIAQSLRNDIPLSVRARVVQARNAKAMNDYREALVLYRSLAEEFKEEVHFIDQMLRLENQLGAPASIFSIFSVAADETGRKSHISQSIDSMDYPEAKLMWARALWSEGEWEESLDVYGLLDTELKRDIDQLIDLLQNRPELSGQASAYMAEKGIFDLDEQEFVDLLMSTDFISAHLQDEINIISADFYSYYRWGKIVDKEMTAKSSLKAREFYQAEIDYQKLFEEGEELTEPIYPDLATVYGRLGKYKEETKLIETIQERSIFAPELSRAAEQSIRRQQPFLALEGFYNREDGRDGFKNIIKKYLGVALEVKPTLSQEIGVKYGRNDYGNSFASTLAKSNYMLGNYAIQFGEHTEGSFKLGFEDFDTDSNSFLIYDARLKSSLEQRLKLYGAVKQEPVDDTIESLEDNIYRKDVQFGINLDYLFGLFFGFDLNFYDYNDNNGGESYYLWSAYRWFGDRSSIDFTYSYLKLQNDIANGSGPVLDDDDEIPSYWSPGDYWKHKLAAFYKLELWPTGRLQSGTSSLSAMYALGYEKDDIIVHEFEANILLEIGQPFLVKGTFSTLVSDDYDNLKGYLSLVYRW